MSTRHKARIRDWKGLIHDAPRRDKILLFMAMLLVSASMTFTQYGFIGIGSDGQYYGYVLGLLGPLAVVSLLLGKGAGTLFGTLSGAILYAHTRIQPLDMYERYLVSSLNSIALFLYAGLLLGLAFAIALRNNPRGKRRIVYLGLACAISSLILSIVFFINGFVTIAFSLIPAVNEATQQVTVSSEWVGAFKIMKGEDVQILCDFILMLGVCLIADCIVRLHSESIDEISVRTTFDVQLFIVAALVFCVVQAVSFVIITYTTEQQTLEHMSGELKYLEGELTNALEHKKEIVKSLEPYGLPAKVVDSLTASSDVEDILEGYHLSDGTVIIFHDDTVVSSYNPACPVGTSMTDLFDTWRTGTLDELAETGRLQEMLYATAPLDNEHLFDETFDAELGYMHVRKAGDYYLLMAMPSSMVFANRWSIMTWASVTAFALLATFYVLASRLLSRNVISPIDRTNDSLAQITSGNLDETVNERDSREFSSLSTGINETVGALKGLINEAERRNERDLAVAKRIQESALPRTFPPYPEIGAFDIFAAMDAAKEVGGDFFDFFLVDDTKLAFLIADVSGKGIPGALFMMAAKTEIENYLSTGMEPAAAIASANHRLCANNDAGMFVTVWAATLEWETGLLTYVNAGHNFPLLRRGRSGSWEWLKKRCGLFLGTFETAKYRQETLVLEPGDELLLYTDGVNEAFNSEEEEYGNDRLEAFLATHRDVHPRELVRSLRADVSWWADGAEQSDDVTILALEYGVAPEVTGSLTVPATLDHLSDAVALVTGELERRLCPVTVQNKVEMALEELFVNVCRYAYEDADVPGSVTVSYAYGTNPSSITVELRDTGIPFDPVNLDDPTKPSTVQEAKIGGLGILMVKRTMDDIAYLRDDDTNIIVFKKGW